MLFYVKYLVDFTVVYLPVEGELIRQRKMKEEITYIDDDVTE